MCEINKKIEEKKTQYSHGMIFLYLFFLTFCGESPAVRDELVTIGTD